jgi:hypothetical protein
MVHRQVRVETVGAEQLAQLAEHSARLLTFLKTEELLTQED